MRATVTSFGTNLTNSFTSQSPKNRLKFNQKISFFADEKLTMTQTKDFYSTKDQLRQYISERQEISNFIDYQEFQNLNPGEVGLSILSYYNKQFKSTGWDESLDEFNSRIETLVEATKRRYPFLKIFRKIANSGDQNYLQIQMSTNYLEDKERKNVVLFQQDVFEHTINLKSLVEGVGLFLRKFNLIVTIDCEHKDLTPIGCDLNHANKLLEGLKVTIRQKEDNNQIISPTKQIIIKSTICNLSASRASNSKVDLFKTNENINMEKQVRVYFSPNKNQNWMTVTNLSQADVVHKNYKSSGKNQTSEAKQPVKLFQQSVYTNYFEQATFQDLVQQISNYEIDIMGNNIRPSKTIITVDDLLKQQDEQLMVSIRVERSDVAKCMIKIIKDGLPVRDALIKISTLEGFNNGYDIVQNYDEKNDCFYFCGLVNSIYYIEIQKKDCFPQKKTVHILNDNLIETELVGCVQTQLKFRAFNVTESVQFLDNVLIEITQPEDLDKETMFGETDQKGNYSCPGLMFKQLHLKAKRKGFLSVSYDYDVRANSTGTVLSIPMLPDYYSLINCYHIIVYVPQKRDFQLAFTVKCPDNSVLDEKNPQHKVHKAKLDVSPINKKGKLLNFQVHVQCLDPFIKNNLFQFVVQNERPNRTPLCGQTTQKQIGSPSKQTSSFMTRSINEVFMTTRISQNTIQSSPKRQVDVVTQKMTNYCAEDSVRVFVTFGHEVIYTFMIQSNVLTTQEKCFGVIDLDKRKFNYYEDQQTLGDCQKSIKSLKIRNQPQQQHQSDSLEQILSQITNQKFKVR